MPGLLPIKWRHGWGRMIKFFHDKVQLIYVLSISVGFHVGFQLPGYGMVKVPWGSMLGSMLVSCFQGIGEVTIRKVPLGPMLGSMLGSMLVSSCQVWEHHGKGTTGVSMLGSMLVSSFQGMGEVTGKGTVGDHVGFHVGFQLPGCGSTMGKVPWVPLWQSGWLSRFARVAGPATQPLWQSGWTSHSGRAAEFYLYIYIFLDIKNISTWYVWLLCGATKQL